MNTDRSLGAILLMGLLLCFSSCNNNSTSTASTTDTTTNTTTSTTAPAATTPQTMLVIRGHITGGYAKWKMAYDSHDTARVSHGLHNYVIGRGITDSNTTVVALKVDDTTRAMSFIKSADLKQAMARGGVSGPPQISWYTAVYQDTATISSKLRSSASFMVKDWNTWLQHFQAGEQDRMNNGIRVRSYGHDGSNPNRVRVVTALVDSARAMAYYNSDAMRKRMDSAGVIGKPDRFYYRLVEVYR